MSISVNPAEIEHFSKDSAHWWDEEGPFRPLHRLGPARLEYIRDRINIHFNKSPKGLKILDIGCGGGLISEPLARLGAHVTGLDADRQAIEVAKKHAAEMGLDIDYICGAAENITKRQFDVILALEIVEHVADLDGFINSCAKLCRPGGIVIFSTLNRTPKSFLLGIVAAEYILRWVPRGTHDWKKFVRPSELSQSMRAASLIPKNIAGYSFNPASDSFEMADNVSVNYFITAEKP